MFRTFMKRVAFVELDHFLPRVAILGRCDTKALVFQGFIRFLAGLAKIGGCWLRLAVSPVDFPRNL